MSRYGLRNIDSYYRNGRGNSRNRNRHYSRSRSRSRERSISVSYSRRDSRSGSYERRRRQHRHAGNNDKDLYRDLISDDCTEDQLNNFDRCTKTRISYQRRNDNRRDDERERDREKRDKNYNHDYRDRSLDYEMKWKRSRENRSSSYSNGTAHGNETRDKSIREPGKHIVESCDSEESDDSLLTRHRIKTSNEAYSQIVLLGLKKNVTEADITAELLNLNFEPNSVRLMRSKSTGASRGFAFVKFNSVGEAKRWMELTQGSIMLADRRVSLRYSTTDWNCAKCGVFNFKHRSACFSCSASRVESELLTESSEGLSEVSPILTKKIMLRFLDALTTEEGVLTALQNVLPNLAKTITKVLISRDTLTNTSRGICYLQFETLVDSMDAHNALTSLEPPLRIDDRDVEINYCLEPESSVQPKTSQAVSAAVPPCEASGAYTLDDVPRLAEYSASLYATTTAEHAHYVKYYTDYYKAEIATGGLQVTETNSGAAVAPSAMQRKQSGVGSSSATAGAEAAQAAAMVKATFTGQSVVVPRGNEGTVYPTPNVSLYQFDASSGYYYDPSTGLYYDAHSQYYYNNDTGAYLYWDQRRSTYIRATPATTRAALQETLAQAEKYEEKNKDTAKQNTNKENKQNKVTVAKKIVKDMQKWAQHLNHKKGYMEVTTPEPMLPVEQPQTPRAAANGYADLGFSILHTKENGKLNDWVPIPAAAPTTKLVNAYGGDTDSEEDNVVVVPPSTSSVKANIAEKLNYVDFQNLTCLLCKRVFQSLDILQKHLKMSNLHKENLAKLNIPSNVGASNEDASDLSYRDRAKERRLKYGEDDAPPPNPCRDLYDEIKNSQTRASVSAPAPVLPISCDNVGNRLLQKMGWSEGQGLGRKNQGRTEIIETVARSNNEGLGSNKPADSFGVDYKSYIKKMMKSRYDNG